MYGSHFKSAQKLRHSYLDNLIDSRNHFLLPEQKVQGVSADVVKRRRELQAAREERQHTREAWEE